MSDVHYIKLTANKNPMKGGSFQPKEWYRFFDEFLHHYYVERVAFYALIKHIFKIDLQKDKISCAKDFISCHMQTVALNPAQKFKIKEEISLVRKLRLWTYKFKLPWKLVNLYITSESSLKN